MIAQNLKYLRQKHDLSQQTLAARLDIPRTTLSDYERGHSSINLETLIKISDIFDVNIDSLIKKKLYQEKFEIFKNEAIKILAISVDSLQRPNIELVETKAEAGYLQSHSNPEYIKDLPKIYFPNIPQGTYRGFQIKGDSMLPLEPGSIIICQYVESINDIKNNKPYVIISKNEGVVYKRLRHYPELQKLLLLSDNDTYRPYEIDYEEVSEIWQYYAHLSFADPKYTFQHMLEDKISDMHLKINEIHKKIVN